MIQKFNCWISPYNFEKVNQHKDFLIDFQNNFQLMSNKSNFLTKFLNEHIYYVYIKEDNRKKGLYHLWSCQNPKNIVYNKQEIFLLPFYSKIYLLT